MQVETTPWYEARSLIAPQIEMLQEDGMIQYKKSFLKSESPQTAVLKARFIHYNANYVKYCLLKEFYQLLLDGIEQGFFEGDENRLVALLTEVVTDFTQYCRKQPLEKLPRETFRSFCKVHLYR